MASNLRAVHTIGINLRHGERFAGRQLGHIHRLDLHEAESNMGTCLNVLSRLYLQLDARRVNSSIPAASIALSSRIDSSTVLTRAFPQQVLPFQSARK